MRLATFHHTAGHTACVTRKRVTNIKPVTVLAPRVSGEQSSGEAANSSCRLRKPRSARWTSPSRPHQLNVCALDTLLSQAHGSALHLCAS